TARSSSRKLPRSCGGWVSRDSRNTSRLSPSCARKSSSRRKRELAVRVLEGREHRVTAREVEADLRSLDPHALALRDLAVFPDEPVGDDADVVLLAADG